MNDSSRVPKRILMSVDAIGGVWAYALDLVRALEPHGVEIELAVMGTEPDDGQRAAVNRLPNVRLHVSRYRLEWMEEPWDDVAAAGEWLLALERRLAPDLIHLNGYVHAALPWTAPVLVVGHSCICSWFESVRGTAAPEKYDRYRAEVARGLGSAGLVTAPSASMLAALRRHYGPFPAAPAVYNGRRAADFPPREKEPFVLAAGRLWDEAKNVAALARAAGRLSWPVYVAGDEQHPENGGRARFEGVVHLGRLDPAALAAWMGRAAIYALPARYEPFGLTPLEAALAGCALVLADIPTLREIWQEDAVFVAPDDDRALAAAVQALIDDPLRRHRLAARARARATLLTPERMAAGYLDLYARLLADRRPASTADRSRPDRDAREMADAASPGPALGVHRRREHPLRSS